MFQPVGEQCGFQGGAEISENAQQADTFTGVDALGDAAGLQGQGMRPFSGQQAHQMQETGARRHQTLPRLSTLGGEASLRRLEPRAVGINRAGEIGHEEQDEMGQVVGGVFRRQYQIGDQPAIVGHGDAGDLGQGTGRRHRLRHRTDAADARRDDQGVFRRAPGQDLLEAAIQGRGDLGRLHLTGGNVQADFQITFDPVERAHDQAGGFGIHDDCFGGRRAGG